MQVLAEENFISLLERVFVSSYQHTYFSMYEVYTVKSRPLYAVLTWKDRMSAIYFGIVFCMVGTSYLLFRKVKNYLSKVSLNVLG